MYQYFPCQFLNKNNPLLDLFVLLKDLSRTIAQLDDAAPHLFMVGRTREGKSETLKHLIGAEKRVWYVTSKATDRVPQHWQGYRVGGRNWESR